MPDKPNKTATQSRRWSRIDQLADEWVETLAELSPTFASAAGLPGDPSGYDDYSPDGLAEYQTQSQRVQRAVTEASPTDRVDEVTKDALLRDLGLATRLYESGWWFRNLNNLASPAQGIRDVYDNMPTATATDWEVIAQRLRNLPAALEGYTQTLLHGRSLGMVPAQRQIAVVAQQVEGNLGPDGFFAVFAKRAKAGSNPLPDGLHRELSAAAAEAAGAYERFRETLLTELAPAGARADGVGREHYQLLSEFFLGAKVDLDETYKWGLEELAQMTAEQEAVAETIRPGASVAEAIAILDADPERTLHGTHELRSWMQRLADTAVTELGRHHFTLPEPVRRIECMIAPTQNGGIYYTGPSADFSRPGRMWWSVPPGVTEFNTWRETTTVYHEGVPGHHLQIATATYQRGQLNSWRRLAAGTSGFWEGWALYAERLMEQLGYLSDPGDRLGMLDAQRMRAARVVLDIGVHLGKLRPDGAGVWDADYAYGFFSSHVNMDDASVRFEIERYLGWPGQAPSYKIGQRIWEQCRDDFLATRPGTSLRDFHKHALELGNLGLDSLRYALNNR